MKRDTEGSMQHVVSFVLRAGVLCAAGMGVIAVAANLLHHAADKVSFSPFKPTPADERIVSSIFANALHGQPRALMMMALIVLLATPIARVAVSLLGFIKEKDRVYVIVTTVVFITLLCSLFLGGATE